MNIILEHENHNFCTIKGDNRMANLWGIILPFCDVGGTLLNFFLPNLQNLLIFKCRLKTFVSYGNHRISQSHEKSKLQTHYKFCHSLRLAIL